MNGAGQLLSGVQILMRIGQIIVHCRYWGCQQRPKVKEWLNLNGKDFAGTGLRKRFLIPPVLLDPLNAVINSPCLLSLLAPSFGG